MTKLMTIVNAGRLIQKTGMLTETSVSRSGKDIKAITTVTDLTGKEKPTVVRQTDLDAVIGRLGKITNSKNWFSIIKQVSLVF